VSQVVVYCHGACQHFAGYSDAMFAALLPYTDAFGAGQLGVTRFEVLWSDLLNPGGPSKLAGCIQDFLDYLYELPTRMAIIQRVKDVIRPLLIAGNLLTVIAHSEGTVATYEALRALDLLAFPGRVVNFITLGAALCYAWDPAFPETNVRDYLLLINRDGAKPAIVSHWWNLNAAGDPFGGPLAPAYGVDMDWIRLPAVGCPHNAPLCAHGSYFHMDNTAVNRDIIAAKINES
jgi:metacaspase-1